MSDDQNTESLNIQRTSQNPRNTNGANIINVDLFQASNQLSDQLETVHIENQSDDLNDEGQEESQFLCPVVMVFGGMDASGNFYNDLMLTKISE